MQRVRSSILILISVMFVVSLVPQPADALVAWVINRNPNGFVNMTPGGSFPTGLTVATTDEETTTTFYSRYVIGDSVFRSDTTVIEPIDPRGTATADLTIWFTSDVMNSCIDGFIATTLELIVIQPDGTEVVNYSLPWNAPCSVSPDGPAFAYAVEPAPVAVCGPNNDTVPTTDQPDGIILVSDTGWQDGTRTVVFGADEGYFLEGQSEFTFTDAALPCVTEAPLSPVQTAVCGPNNDELEFTAQPENVVLATDSDWVDGSRTITYTAADGFVIEGQSEFTFTDANTTCPVEPEEPIEPEPVDPVPTDTPDPVVPDPTATPDPVVTPDPTAVPTEVADTAPQAHGTVTGLPQTGTGETSSATSLFGLLAAFSAPALILIIGSGRIRQN